MLHLSLSCKVLIHNIETGILKCCNVVMNFINLKISNLSPGPPHISNNKFHNLVIVKYVLPLLFSVFKVSNYISRYNVNR